MRRKNFVGIVDFHEDDPEEEVIQYCPSCFESNRLSKLGPKSWKGQQPVDNDLFCQCYFCGEIYAVHEIEKQKLLKSDTKRHKSDNEFEAKQGIVTGIPKRYTKEGKKIATRKRRERQRTHHKDPEIDREIQQHGEDNVKVVYDSNP